MSNLFGYGPCNTPIAPATPIAATHPKLRLRAEMWGDALTAHQAGRIRATEVRGSDYIEANSIFSAPGAPVSAGKRAYVPAALDTHSWTSIADVAKTLVMVATREQAWGQAWLVPTNPALTVRELATRFAILRGLPAPKLTTVPYTALWAAGLFSPLMRELRATNYQWTRPFLLDSTLTEQTFGLTRTPIDMALAAIPSANPIPAVRCPSVWEPFLSTIQPQQRGAYPQPPAEGIVDDYRMATVPSACDAAVRVTRWVLDVPSQTLVRGVRRTTRARPARFPSLVGPTRREEREHQPDGMGAV